IRVPNIVEPEICTIEEVVPMADQTMEELLQAPTEGYGEAIIIPELLAENFKIKTNLLQLVQSNKFYGFERDNPYTHIKLTQIDTFYNGLNEQDQDSLNTAASGNLLSKTTREALKIIENKSKVRYSRSKLNVSRVNANSRESSSKTNDRINKLADQISNLVEIVNKKVITPAIVKAVEKSCVICGGAHAYYDCITTDSNQSSVCAAMGIYNQVSSLNRASNQMPPPGFALVQNNQNVYNQNQGQGNNFNRGNNFQVNVLRGDFNKQEENLRRNLNNDMGSILGSFFQNQASTLGTLLSNTIPNSKGKIKAVTTRSGLAYEGPSIPTNSSFKKVVERESEETTDKEQPNCQGSTAHIQPLVVPTPIPEPIVLKTQPKPNIPYPSRLNDQKLREKATNQMERFFQIFHDLHFDISFANALLLMPKFAYTIKSLLTNKDKLFELAKVPLNENCSSMHLKKLPKKLGDPEKFLIPCDFPRIDVCHALADLGASINLMPLSIWKKLSLPELTPTRMTLELAGRSITRPKGVAEDVFIKVGKFHFPTDFMVIDFKADPRVPLILGRSFLSTGHALIDVYGEEITLQEYVQDVLDFKYNSKSGNPTLVSNPSFFEEAKSEFCKEPIVKSSSSTLTPFGESDFLLEEIEDFLKDESIPTRVEDSYYDLEGDILYLEKLINDDPSQLPSMDLKQAEDTKAKSSIEVPPGLELKELPSHLEYVFLEGTDKLPVIIAKDLKDVEKEALLKVLKSHKRVIAWKIPTSRDFSKIARPMTHLFEKKTPFVFSKYCVDAFETLKKKLTKSSILVVPDWNLPSELIFVWIKSFAGVCMAKKLLISLKLVMKDPPGAIMVPISPLRKENFHKKMKCLKMLFKFMKYSMYEVEARALPTNNARVVVKFLISLFARFGTPRAIISNRGTHFCNDQFAKVITKYRVTHHLATAYHPQTSGQVEVSNRGLKRILKRTVGENRTSWSDNLDDALWTFCTAFKTPIGCTTYKLVYEKSCHLPIELEHKAYWALKHANFDLKTAGDHRKLQLNELNELRDQAYKNSLIYKERTKKIHDSKLKNRIFNIGDQVLLFNSRLKIFLRMLKTRWSRPFTITQVFPYGTVELSQPDV
nr:reverse transcriptase domain-containing protein [Tanacetum cinerariifolium]